MCKECERLDRDGGIVERRHLPEIERGDQQNKADIEAGQDARRRPGGGTVRKPAECMPNPVRKPRAQHWPWIRKHNEHRPEQPDHQVLHLMRRKQARPGGRKRADEGNRQKHHPDREQCVPDGTDTLAHQPWPTGAADVEPDQSCGQRKRNR